MTDDYKQGLITGLAMQPLYVATSSGSGGEGDTYCGFYFLAGDIVIEDIGWKMIDWSE